jgi:hypothetical protein
MLLGQAPRVCEILPFRGGVPPCCSYDFGVVRLPRGWAGTGLRAQALTAHRDDRELVGPGGGQRRQAKLPGRLAAARAGVDSPFVSDGALARIPGRVRHRAEVQRAVCLGGDALGRRPPP